MKRLSMLTRTSKNNIDLLIDKNKKLNYEEAQIVIWLLSQISEEDGGLQYYKLELSEFSRLVTDDSGDQYAEMIKITRALMEKVVEIFDPETQKITQLHWVCGADFQFGQECVILSCHPKLKPLLLKLKELPAEEDIIHALVADNFVPRALFLACAKKTLEYKNGFLPVKELSSMENN